MKKPILLFVIFYQFAFVYSQNEIPEMVTDRPDQTESSAVVPVKRFQVETGFVLESDLEGDTKTNEFAYNTTLLRIGIFSNTELRLGFDYLGIDIENETVDYTYSAAGFGPVYAGFKSKLLDGKGMIPEIAFLGGLVMPFTSKAEFKPSYTAASLRFAFSHTLSERFSLGYNLGSEWDGESPIPEYYYSLALGIGFTDVIGAFVESFGTIPEKGKSENLVDAGFTFLLTDNFQLDISGGLGLNDEAIDKFIGFGLSIRVPN